VTEQELLSQLRSESQRFELWAQNTAAYRRDTNCLEHKLRDASHLKTAIFGFLENIETAISRALSIISAERVPWDLVPKDDAATSEDDTGSQGSFAESDSSDDEQTTELDQIVSHISGIVGALLRLSISIQNPAPHDRFFKSAKFDPSAWSQNDVQHVENKFIDVEPWLAERLGQAISWRRQFFSYRQHHSSLRERDAPDNQTVVSSIPEEAKQRLQNGADYDDNDAVSETAPTQTSFQTTLPDGQRLMIPKMPAKAEDSGYFECPLCFTLIRVKGPREWK
jgi:hypothetical protein